MEATVAEPRSHSREETARSKLAHTAVGASRVASPVAIESHHGGHSQISCRGQWQIIRRGPLKQEVAPAAAALPTTTGSGLASALVQCKRLFASRQIAGPGEGLEGLSVDGKSGNLVGGR